MGPSRFLLLSARKFVSERLELPSQQATLELPSQQVLFTYAFASRRNKYRKNKIEKGDL
jgi:hypothetical protein